jgi:hypothetical protein
MYVKSITQNTHVLCLQEHWLLNFERSTVDEYFPNYKCQIKCVDDNTPLPPKYRIRGHAGTIILWPETIDQWIEPLPDGSDRTNVVIINTADGPILLINSYMPTEGAANSDYNELLDEVYEIMCKYTQCTVIWAGDINASTNRAKPTTNDIAFSKFCCDNKLSISPCTPNGPTFHHSNGKSKSRIDLFVQRSSETLIDSIVVDSRSAMNTSDHDAVTATISVCPPHCTKPKECPSTIAAPQRVKWKKVDRCKYAALTEIHLDIILSDLQALPCSVIVERVNQILVDCAIQASPQIPKRKKARKFRWHPELVAAAKTATNTYKQLKRKENSPEYQSTKALHVAAKKALRKAQRQLAARDRRATNRDVIQACHEGSRQNFYKMIKKQRSGNQVCGNINFGPEATGIEREDWASYFTQLATPKENPHFDVPRFSQLQITNILQSLLAANLGPPIQPVTMKDIHMHVNSLKNNKSADLYGVSAEHIKLCAPAIMDILCHLVNIALRTGKIPETFKMGSVTPVHKKGKSPKDPNNYRRITITSIVGKVIEKEILKLTRRVVNSQQNKMQFGFTSGISPIYAAVVLTEILAEAKDCKTPIFVTFMDTAKAFDVVQHPVMLDSLFNQGILGSLWHLYSDMYAGIQSVVKWNGELSSPFCEGQGIRQGGTSSADVYKAGKNSLLSQLEDLSTFKIGNLHAGAVMVADDLALIASNEHHMQQALTITEIDASRDRYVFNCDKTKTVYINSKLPPSLTLYDQELGCSTSEKHLGIHRNAKNTNIDTIHERVKSARRASYSLMGAGLHGLNGVGPEVAFLQYKVYVIPILLYGLESLVLSPKELETLEIYHRTCLRYIQHLPISTAKVALHLLSGVLPVKATLDIQTLTLFRNIVTGDDAAPSAHYMKELLYRQLAMKHLDNSSWASHVRRLLHMYDLPTAYELLKHPPSKLAWKQTVKTAIYEYHHNKLLEEATERSSLVCMNTSVYCAGMLHPMWKDLVTPVDIRRVTVVAQLLVGRYPLATSRTRGKAISSNICPLCKNEPETLEHFLLYCTVSDDIRCTHLPHLLYICKVQSLNIAPENLVSYILDSTYLQKAESSFSTWSSKWVYRLHQRRSSLLANSTSQRIATGS